MAEMQLQLREQKTLKALSETTEPVRVSDLAEATGETPLNMGNSLRQLAKQGLAEFVDKRSKLWQITNSGRQIAATIELPASELELGASAQAPAQPPAQALAQPPAPQTVTPSPVVPSQIDIFKDIGEHLGIRQKKEGTPLDAIVYYVVVSHLFRWGNILPPENPFGLCL